jgi:ribosomal protein S18 acetylase RimI-like enzyme
LGWFGLLPKERENGYGEQIYNYAADVARDEGFTHLQLYTSKTENKNAVKFYKKLGLTEETYINRADSVCKDDNVLIFSRNLRGDKTVPWDNKNLYING